MRRKRLLWQLFPPMVLVLIVTVSGGAFFGLRYVKDFCITQTVADLTVRTQLVLRQVEAPLLAHDFKRVNDLCQEIGRQARARVTVMVKDGKVIADSAEDPGAMDNHADREEMLAALAGGTGTATRLSKTVRTTMLYVAVPVYDGRTAPGNAVGSIAGAVRLSIPLTPVENLLRDLSVKIFFGALFLVVLAALITLSFSRTISRPLEDMQAMAARFGQHKFDRKITFASQAVSREVAGLAETLNQMAADLHQRIETVTQQKNELEAVFKSMVEAVIVIDRDEKIEHLNEAALRLLGLSSKRGIGKSMVETVRNADLLKFVREAALSPAPAAREILFAEGGQERHFHASGTALFDGGGLRIGALIVLNDVTKMQRLEAMRREFVANVSHELKTPITSIKGFVETICDGEAKPPEDVERFLGIILKQANRLNDIVDDLLALSRIEEEEERAEIELQPGPLSPVLQNCLEAGAMKAMAKKITLTLDCDRTLPVRMNPHLLEQAVTNLLINAIKYSPEGGEVRVAAIQDQAGVSIRVIDQGCGIAAEHLPRLFERFYRSDKARSRKLGGTGLGLAIAKHIVQAHGGTIGVESVLGRGSTFTIRLPYSSSHSS